MGQMACASRSVKQRFGDFPNNIRAFSAIDACLTKKLRPGGEGTVYDRLGGTSGGTFLYRDSLLIDKVAKMQKMGPFFLTLPGQRGCCDLEWWIGTQPNALCASDFQGGTVYVYSMLARFLGWIWLFDLSVYIGSGWWQLKYVLFSPSKLGKIPILTTIFQWELKPPTGDGLNPRHSKILWSGPGEGVGVSLEPLKIRTSGDVWRWTITDTDPHQVSGCPGKDQ